MCPAFHAAVWRQGEAAGGTGAGAGERADAGARARRAVRGGGYHLARLAAVGLGLALGALQQRRRQRLAARGVAAQPDQVGGLQRQHAGVAVDFDTAPPGARVLGLHHLAADAVELGRADERVHLNVCATRHLAEGEKRLRRGHQHREVAGPECQLAPVGTRQPDPPAPRAGIKLHDLALGAIALGGSQERVELHTRADGERAVVAHTCAGVRLRHAARL